MAGSTRIKGNALKFTLAGVDFYADISNLVVDNEESDGGVTTFADAASGGSRQFFMTGTAVQSTQSSSFWSMVWANSGATVAYVAGFSGNAVATADQPLFTGTAVIGPKPSIGGDAGINQEQTFDFRFNLTAEPTIDRGTAAQAAITAITPAGKSAGQSVTISGVRFTGVTNVLFGATAATNFTYVSDSVIVATIPSGTGAKAVTVVTPAGTSSAVNYTVV